MHEYKNKEKHDEIQKMKKGRKEERNKVITK